MKKINTPIIILIIIAIITLGFGISSTVSAVESGKQYQEGMKAYNQFADAEGTLIGDYAAKLAAQAFSSSETAQIVKKDLYKSFSISLAMYLICGVSIYLIFNQLEKQKKEE